MRKVLLQKAWTFIELNIQAKTTSKNETLPEKPVLLSACCSLFRPSRPIPLLNHSQELVRFNQLTRTSEVYCIFCSNSSTPQRPAVLQEERKKRRDAASQELSNEIGKKRYSFVPFTAEGYFVLLGFTRHLSTVKQFWNLLIIQTSCISQLYGQTNTRKRF